MKTGWWATFAGGVALAVVATAAQAQDTIKIGGIFSLNGPAAPFGVPERDIVEALTKNINAQGGINGKTIELVICDEQTNPTEAARCATKLARQDRVVAIVGPTTGTGALAMGPIALANKIPFLAPVGTIPVTSKDHAFWPWVFRTAPSDTLIINTLFERAVFQPKRKRIGILYQEDAYGEAGMKLATRLSKEHDFEIATAVGAPLSAIDLTAAATNIRNANSDVVLVKTSAPALGAAFMRAAKQVGISAPIIGTGSLNQRPFLDAAGPAAEGIQIVSIGNWDDPSDKQKKLGEVIVAAGKTPKGYAELIASTGALAAFEAIRRVKGEVTGAAIRDALEAICDFKDTYLDGNLCYSKDQHEGVFEDTLITVEIRDGKFKTVK